MTRNLRLVNCPTGDKRESALDKDCRSLLNALALFFDGVRAEKESCPMAEPEVDLSKKYDAVIIGSGAAGGMAAHVLTTHGLQVLMLEAGKKLNIEQELRSMEWPYDNPHRGGLPPSSHSLTHNEYTIRRPPYGPGFEKSKNLYSYIGSSDYMKNIVVNERDNPYTGTNYAWVRARCLGGKTNIWGRLALRLSDYDFKAKDRDGFGENWPISYSDIAPYYDKVDLYLGITGVKENLPYLPDSIFQRPTKFTCAEVTLKEGIAKMGRVLTQYRAGVTTDGLKHKQIPQPVLWPRRLLAQRRLRYSRGVRFAHRTDLSGDGHRQHDVADEFDCARNYRRSANGQSVRRALHRFADPEGLHRARESGDCRGIDSRIRATPSAF